MKPLFLRNPDSSASGGATVQTPPQTFEVEEGGQIVRLTQDELLNRYKTYSGKASAFDKTAEERAGLSKQLEELKPRAELASKFETVASRLRAVDDTGIPDPEAAAEMAKLLMGPEKGEAFIRERLGAGNAGGQTPAAQAAAAGVDPRVIAEMYRKLQALEKGPAVPPDIQKELDNLKTWQRSQESSTLGTQIREYLLKEKPALGKIISDDQDGAAILGDVVQTVMSKRVSGQALDPKLVDAAVSKYERFLGLVDRQFPAQAVPQPSMFGSTPTAAQTTSRLVEAKEPKLEDFKGPKAMDEFMAASANWYNQQAFKAATSG